MGEGVGLQAHQGAVGIYRQSHRGKVRLRVARRFRSLVPLLWQRKLGVQPGWVDGHPAGVNQRPSNRRIRTEIFLAARPPARRSPGIERLGPLMQFVSYRRKTQSKGRETAKGNL